jgi:hypothetical protein
MVTSSMQHVCLCVCRGVPAACLLLITTRSRCMLRYVQPAARPAQTQPTRHPTPTSSQVLYGQEACRIEYLALSVMSAELLRAWVVHASMGVQGIGGLGGGVEGCRGMLHAEAALLVPACLPNKA